MKNDRLSDFQTRVAATIQEMAREREVPCERFDAVVNIPFVSRDSMPIVELRVGRMTVWLWDDEAATKIPIDPEAARGFERLDYPSLEALEHDLLAHVAEQMKE